MRQQISFAFIVAVSAIGAFGATSPASAANGRKDNYCLQGPQSGYPGNCEFATYQQCAATASGTYETCGFNPMNAYNQQGRGYHHSNNPIAQSQPFDDNSYTEGQILSQGAGRGR